MKHPWLSRLRSNTHAANTASTEEEFLALLDDIIKDFNSSAVIHRDRLNKLRQAQRELVQRSTR